MRLPRGTFELARKAAPTPQAGPGHVVEQGLPLCGAPVRLSLPGEFRECSTADCWRCLAKLRRRAKRAS